MTLFLLRYKIPKSQICYFTSNLLMRPRACGVVHSKMEGGYN